ncbi:hypothetical protein B0F90DRAFT_1811407 [Multifurca ochricompacta]|uniref:Matrin-type domain-containing protein n=1 Tax=Multifurca ochricompacta TaxID=376703 RepID=A0AAD4LZ27_9AGAM|nr:hypothetical protein B0F90DRAFT_1811407 [Multifurca ochricompacta]
MSEYWVSKKRYFCKYCDVYISDDVPSRQHHENGLRHKGNVDRFVRGLYKAGEKRKKDAEEEKERCCQCGICPGCRCGSSAVHVHKSAPSTAGSSSSQKPERSGGISDYSTPESLGYIDPEIERARTEAERRRTQGVVGEWQYVESASIEPLSGTGEGTQHEDGTQDPEASKKRTLPDPADEEEGRWKLRKKTTSVGLGEIYDPGIISIKLKTKTEVKEEGATGQVNQSSSTTSFTDAKATSAPKWAPVKWKKAGEPTDDTIGAAGSAPSGGRGSSRADRDKVSAPVPIKLEEAATPSGEGNTSKGSLFRKRKAPLGAGASSRGRRF